MTDPAALTEEKPDELVVERVAGLFVGSLSDDELDAFNRCVIRGTAYRDYSGAAGFFGGLAKVRMVEQEIP